MGFADWAAARRRSVDLKNELKELRGHILNTGVVDKAELANDLKELLEALESAALLWADYKAAREHLRQAIEKMELLLEQMGMVSAAELKTGLQELVVHLEGVYNDCLIQADDIDYEATVRSLKLLVEQYSERTARMQAIVLRSELENVKAVLDDASGWSTPDFLALAYYCLHEDKNMLRDMENTQRNRFVQTYFKEKLMDGLLKKVRLAGREEAFGNMIKEYIYGKDCE